MRLSWISDLPEHGNLRQQWDALVLEVEKPEVFFTCEWAAAVVRTLRSTLQPWIGTAYEGEKLVGIAALAKTSPSEAVFLAGSTADYCDFISHPEKRREFVAAVLSSLKEQGIRRVVLPNLPSDSATIAALEGSKIFRSFFRIGYVCAQVELGSEEQRRPLGQQVLKKTMFRRAMRDLERLGPVVLRHTDSPGLPDGILDVFFLNHVARFLATGRLSNLVVLERRQFLSELARLLTERGWFDLMTLCVGDRDVAYNYGFRFQGIWSWYQPTIVNELEDLSPGFCLLTKLVEDACKNPDAQVVDLGLGAEGYKERFANAQRTTLHVTLSTRAVDHWRAKGRYRAAEAIKKQPRLEAVARRAQKAIAEGSQQTRTSGFVGWSGKQVRRVLSARNQMCLYRWEGNSSVPENAPRMSAMNWETLARAAMRYHDDRETLDYILRSSGRIRAQHHRGYVLAGEDGVAQHFAWVASETGSAAPEAERILPQLSSKSVLIFDGWTPRASQGAGHYGGFLRQLAASLFADGRDVWALMPAVGSASRSEMERAGFRMEFARRKHLQKNL